MGRGRGARAAGGRRGRRVDELAAAGRRSSPLAERCAAAGVVVGRGGAPLTLRLGLRPRPRPTTRCSPAAARRRRIDGERTEVLARHEPGPSPPTSMPATSKWCSMRRWPGSRRHRAAPDVVRRAVLPRRRRQGHLRRRRPPQRRRDPARPHPVRWRDVPGVAGAGAGAGRPHRDLAAGGATRLDAIFLDEGFGTLVETPSTSSPPPSRSWAAGRMVGVVSHVPSWRNGCRSASRSPDRAVLDDHEGRPVRRGTTEP